MTNQTFDHEVNAAVAAVREAVPIVLEIYRRDFDVEFKHAREPVTLADRKVNALLTQRFAAEFPDDGIIAEESVPGSADERAAIVARPRVWFIDPLDGTKEFIARNGEFAIMIGLAVQGRATVGVVAIPAMNEVVVGVVGRGAWLHHDDDSRTPLRVSNVDTLSAAGLVKSRSHRSGTLQELIHALGVQREVISGSVGVKASRIARSQEDIYLYVHAPGGAKLWDGCAPEAIVRAAGGQVSDMHGRPIDYAVQELELTGGFVATNGRLHDAVIAVTSKRS